MSLNLILVSNRLAKARTITLTRTHLLLAAFFGLLFFVAAVVAAQFALMKLNPGAGGGGFSAWLSGAHPAGAQQQQVYLQESLDAMSQRVGQMQAQMLRLDALGARLAKLTGMKPQEFSFDHPPAQGGPFVAASQEHLSMNSLDQQLTQLAGLLADRGDKLEALETMLLQDRLNKNLLPSIAPISEGWYSSNFGWRIDPFTGKNAMHEGVDYTVPEGTSIVASAGGVVVFAGYHPQYGNMVEIDHGGDIVTRYAHASRLLIQEGDMVRRGQEIAKVGSTGRSTGSHLHFEVRYKGSAQNPARFLQGTAS